MFWKKLENFQKKSCKTSEKNYKKNCKITLEKISEINVEIISFVNNFIWNFFHYIFKKKFLNSIFCAICLKLFHNNFFRNIFSQLFSQLFSPNLFQNSIFCSLMCKCIWQDRAKKSNTTDEMAVCIMYTSMKKPFEMSLFFMAFNYYNRIVNFKMKEKKWLCKFMKSYSISDFYERFLKSECVQSFWKIDNSSEWHCSGRCLLFLNRDTLGNIRKVSKWPSNSQHKLP